MQLNLTTATRIGLNTLGLLGMALLLKLGETILIPLTFAVLFAAILWPVASWFHRRRLPWSLACMVSVGLLLAMFVGVTLGLTLAVPRMVQGLPRPGDDEELKASYQKFREKVARISPGRIDPVLPEDPNESKLLHQVQDALRTDNINRVLFQLTGEVSSLLLELVLVMFMVLFLLIEGRMLTQRVVEVFGPSEDAQSRAVGVLGEIAASVRAYLVWRTVVNIGLTLVLGAVYHAVGLRQPWTWAVLTGILCYVPYIGTLIASVPPVLDAFVSVDSPWGAVGILIFYVLVVTFEGYVIVPVVMGRSMDLNATTVLLACLFWYLVWGTPGVFLAMPLMAAVKAVFMSVPGWRTWANLMGTDETPVTFDPPTSKQAEAFDLDKTVLVDDSPLVKEVTPEPPAGEGKP